MIHQQRVLCTGVVVHLLATLIDRRYRHDEDDIKAAASGGRRHRLDGPRAEHRLGV